LGKEPENVNQASAGGKIAIFRAADDAAKSAARLAALGFEAVIAPVMAPIALQAAAPQGAFEAWVATSAKALVLAEPALLAPFAGLPLYVVGAAGAAAAASRGLPVAACAADAASLARALVAELPREGRVLYFAGADRKPEMETTLIRAGFSVSTVEVYAAKARERWSEEEARGVACCRAALHYSRRSAEIALRLAERAGIMSHWRDMAHVTISADAAGVFAASGATKIIVAGAVREEAMLTALAAGIR